MPELQHLNPDAYRLLRNYTHADEEGSWLLATADHVGEDVG